MPQHSFACSTGFYARILREKEKDFLSHVDLLYPVVMDQWALMSREAADAYFLGPHLMQKNCWEKVIDDNCLLRKGTLSKPYYKQLRNQALVSTGAGMPDWIGQTGAETRQSFPLYVRNTSFCFLPMARGGNDVGDSISTVHAHASSCSLTNPNAWSAFGTEHPTQLRRGCLE